MKTSTINVRDMLSVLSVNEVEERIVQVPGVESATVNHAARTATVRYDETRPGVADIKADVHQRRHQSVGEFLIEPVSEHAPTHKHAVVPPPEAAPAPASEAQAPSSTSAAAAPKAAMIASGAEPAPTAPVVGPHQGHPASDAQPPMPAEVKATKAEPDTALAQVVKLVQGAQNSKVSAQLLADKAAKCLVAIFASACLGVLTAQAAEAPMTGMETGGGASQAARQAASMTEMMGAPGLVPFDIMTGQAGKWMIGYQFMTENMDGNLVGTNRIGNPEILKRFFATPTDMTMQMSMGMVMYAPTDKLTLMAMLPYIRKRMNHITVDGARFVERTEGIGDIELRGMYSVYDYETKDRRHRLLLNGGVGLPTGSINAKMGAMQLEYPMQIGSGTYSLLPGITYLGESSPWGWAADFHSTVRFGRNDNGYRLGNRYQSSVSIARQLANWVSLSAGARGEIWKNIRGSDSLLDATDEPTKDPNLQGGKRFSALLGVNFHPQNGALKGQHFHVQGEVPVAESLDGPQLQRRWVIRAGWQLEF